MTIRVLICDDVEDYRYLLRAALELDPELEVVGDAADGEEAIDKARDLRPDVVLLDLSMPVMDGLEALPQVVAAAPDARVVVLSGFDAPGMARQAMELGAVNYLEKGTPPHRIVEAVCEAGATGDAPSPPSTPAANVVRPPAGRSADASELLALARHELAAPLTSALGLARLLEEAPERLNGKREDALGRVVRNLERLQGLVEGFEQIHRIHEGTLELDAYAPVDLRTLLEEVVVQFRDRHQNRRLLLDAPTDIDVEVDPNLFPCTIQNLLSNADKFSPPDEPIEVGASVGPDGPVIWIRDHGPGIPPDQTKQIFDRFVRLDPRIRGLGLGLYLTKAIVEAHGGRVQAENDPEGGARFSIRLPATGGSPGTQTPEASTHLRSHRADEHPTG